MKIIILTAIVALFLAGGSSKGQGSLSSSLLDSPELQMRVKNIDDFINRFNFSRDEKGNLIQYDSSMRLKRERALLWLCSEPLVKRWYVADSASELKPRPGTSNLLAGFVKTAALDSLPRFLSYTQEWSAEATCSATYNGKPATLQLWMSMTTDTVRQGLQWVIDSVAAPFLSLPAHQTTRLNPVSHNLNFMELGKTCEVNPAAFPSFASADFRYDSRAVLFWLITHRMLKIEFVTHLKFHFRQIPGYHFTVENETAQGAHGGWLITDLKTIPSK